MTSTSTSSPVEVVTRCDRHVGEVFSPRCFDCEHPDADRATRSRVGVYSTIVCPFHPGYFIPCDRCLRDDNHNQTGIVTAVLRREDQR